MLHFCIFLKSKTPLTDIRALQDTDLEREVRKRQQRAEAANVQRWRWLLVLCIGATVAILSLIVNLGIAGLNSVKIKATERLIASTGAPLLYHGPDARVPGCFDNLGLPFCFLSEISDLLICASGQESLTCYDNLSLHF